MKKVFLICPVRDANPIQKEKMESYISDLENNNVSVHYPARDTNQNDSVGFRICTDNKNAIINADEVHIFWDKTSQGSLFDLGIAFALNKKLKIVNIEELEVTKTKSFSNMIKAWSEM